MRRSFSAEVKTRQDEKAAAASYARRPARRSRAGRVPRGRAQGQASLPDARRRRDAAAEPEAILSALPERHLFSRLSRPFVGKKKPPYGACRILGLCIARCPSFPPMASPMGPLRPVRHRLGGFGPGDTPKSGKCGVASPPRQRRGRTGRRLRRAMLAGRLGEAEPGVSRGGGPKGKRACPTPAAGGTQPPSLRPSFPRCKSNNPLFRAFRVLSWAKKHHRRRPHTVGISRPLRNRVPLDLPPSETVLDTSRPVRPNRKA